MSIHHNYAPWLKESDPTAGQIRQEATGKGTDDFDQRQETEVTDEAGNLKKKKDKQNKNPGSTGTQYWHFT